ncbi:ATP-dependent DNA helicase PIF1 [Pochonia chlamydosporia 170]|uniref:Amine oxidase n=1 Tax=Pochonia chlamydosporia 170 TaxID=1380566 RepID=A0A179EYX9_METCM|nr:ATP-dependent DNA helicase PIF1 [Pochonia chlamydosporia 170]OAQ58043.1 ATP-dependent DNA helicase PIF1 [Pochonia chlamydosporia 170]
MPGALQNSRVMRGQGDESRSVEALKTVSRIWGVDKVQYYQWAYSGINFCNKLCAAARKVSDWEEAVVKLNMLLHRRSQQLGRRPIKYSVNPIESDDLINLRAWSHKDPYVKKNDRERISLVFSNLAARDLPAGFGFDKFGLMVRSGQQQSGGDQLSREEIESRSPWDGGDWVRDRTEGRLREGHGNLARLRTVRRIWGGDKVQYYQWAHRGEDFCKKLCTAARQVSDWDEAVVKLNRLIHRRAEQIGRRKVKQSVDPIDPDDLVNLKAWSHKDPYVKKKDREGIALSLSKLAVTDLPAGFGFDKFGLMVRTEERQLGSVEESGLGVGRCNRQNVVHTGGKQVRTDRNRRRTKVRRPRDGFASKAVARPGDLFRAFRRVRDGDEQATAQVNPGSREIRGSSLGVLGRLEVREGESARFHETETGVSFSFIAWLYSTGFVTNEDQGKINWAPNAAAQYSVVNKDKPNKFGEYPGFRIYPSTGSSIHLTVENSTRFPNQVNWATHQLYAVQRKDTEPVSAHPITPKLVDFNKFFDGESLDQEDIVLYFNLGMHHMPDTYDLPVTVFQGAQSGITLRPQNYQESDNSPSTRQQIHITNENDKVKVENYGAKKLSGSFDLQSANPTWFPLPESSGREN